MARETSELAEDSDRGLLEQGSVRVLGRLEQLYEGGKIGGIHPTALGYDADAVIDCMLARA